MKIKVCGMRDPQNIEELAKLHIDFMGMIFFERSARHVEQLTLYDLDNSLPETTKRVGVFVNAELEAIMHKVNKYRLDYIQLHGKELPELCIEVSKTIPVIKAFSISSAEDFKITAEYEGLCEYFLFDTKTPQHGGSGQKFDWELLKQYKGDTPFLLSGGISDNDVESIKKIEHPQFAGVDLNSRFETSPGLKNIELLKQFIKELRYEQN